MTSLQLTYIPIIESIHVYLNGVEQYEPEDWIYNSVSNTITSTVDMDVYSDDLLECRYAHNGDYLVWDVPTIVGTPYINWIAGINGGHRSMYVRLEGLPPGRNPPYYNIQSTPSFSGTASYDGNSGAGNLGRANFGINGTLLNILYEDVVKPWYGGGEIAPTGLRVIMKNPNIVLVADQIQWGVGATGNPNGYGPPPPGWQGEIFAPNVVG